MLQILKIGKNQLHYSNPTLDFVEKKIAFIYVSLSQSIKLVRKGLARALGFGL